MQILEGPCYRENCGGTMKIVDGIYVCDFCGIASTIDTYISWLEVIDESHDAEDDYVGVPGYEELYDEDGNYIYCPHCTGTPAPLKLHNGEVTCPKCGATLSLEEFGRLF